VQKRARSCNIGPLNGSLGGHTGPVKASNLEGLQVRLASSQPGKSRGGPPSIRVSEPKNIPPPPSPITPPLSSLRNSHYYHQPKPFQLFQKRTTLKSKWVSPPHLTYYIGPQSAPCAFYTRASMALSPWLIAGSWRGFHQPLVFPRPLQPSISLTSNPGPDHTCSCGASCQCPAGACQCPVSDISPSLLHLYRILLSNRPVD
jgi:hypothetical protein